MAIDFNGTTDRIDIANSFDWAAQAQTWAAWTWWDNIDATSEYLFADNNGANDTATMLFFRLGGDSSIQHTIVTSGTSQVTRTTVGGGAVTSGSWIHFALTWNGAVGAAATDTVIYKNGAVLGVDAVSVNGTGTPTALTGINSLGGRSFDDLRNLDGRLAEVGRWNRVLSAAEVAALAKGYVPKCFLPGLKFYMPLVRSVYNVCSGGAVTLDGTSVIAHPPLIRSPGKRAA
jgi:hypothetical protein